MGVQNLTAKDLQTKGKTEQKYLSDFLKSSDTQFNFINSVLICERTKFYSLRREKTPEMDETKSCTTM